MVKISEATHRLFDNVFVCKKCKAKIRSEPTKIRMGIVKCRKCGCKALRPKKMKK